MTSYGKSESGWFDRYALNAREDQRARIQDHCQRLHPGLLIVLRTIIGQDGIGQVTLQDVRAPHFPVTQQNAQLLDVLARVIATQEFHRSCRGTCTSVQQGDSQFTPRERLVEDGHVADHQGQEAKPQRDLANHQKTSYSWHRSDIPQAKGEKCGSAEVEIGCEADRLVM